MQRVLVLTNRKTPLMPCHPSRARELLRKGKAAVFRKHPFTIILKERSEGVVQSVEIKIDPNVDYGMAVVSAIKKIDGEWRCFIVNREVITVSQYKKSGRSVSREAEKKMFTIAEGLAEGWLPHKNVVMDIALVDGEYKVLEFNCLNASGFYACQIEAIVEAFN